MFEDILKLSFLIHHKLLLILFFNGDVSFFFVLVVGDGDDVSLLLFSHLGNGVVGGEGPE